MSNETGGIVLTIQDLREVSAYAAENAQEVLEIFERVHPDDSVLAKRATPRGRSPEAVSAGRRCATLL